MKFEFSAGGIVLRQAQKKKFEVLVAQHSQHHGWVFPKGLIGDNIKGEKKSASANRVSPKALAVAHGSGETKEEAAVREVKEETGVSAKIIKELEPVTYWYIFNQDPSAGSGQEKIKKTVYYYIMEYISGDIKDHDWEMENVEWLPVDKVEERLTYKSDRKVWEKARNYIKRYC